MITNPSFHAASTAIKKNGGKKANGGTLRFLKEGGSWFSKALNSNLGKQLSSSVISTGLGFLQDKLFGNSDSSNSEIALASIE